MKRALVFLLLFAGFGYIRAAGFTVSTLPDPKKECAECWVANPDGILSEGVVKNINLIAEALKDTSEVEMAVVAINAFDEAEYADAFSFCQELFNTWGIGGTENNAGVLVFLALESRDLRIHTGGGIEGLLPDAKCDEILDMCVSDFSGGNYDDGMVEMCSEIAGALVTDKARAELLLGYKPKSTELTSDLTNYLMFAIILGMAIFVVAYSIWNKNKDKKRQLLLNKTQKVQTATGCLSWIFPFPLLFLYLFLRKQRKQIRTEPIICPKCGKKMRMLSDVDQTAFLSPMRLTEAKIQAREFDVWLCPNCGDTEIEEFEGKQYDKYKKCSSCGALADMQTSSGVISLSTTHAHGKKEINYVCKHCGAAHSEIIMLPLLRPVSSRGGGYYGGGSSHSSGGSWGGGSSFGGGAGRKF